MDLNDFRKNKDDYFKNHPDSPLTQEQKQDFDGLKYFSENPNLVFEIKIDRFQNQEEIKMQTSTGDLQTYTRYGQIQFNIENEDYSLTIFSSNHGYFLPFVDSQAGKETYGAGRYLEPQELPGDYVTVDFNLSYNPYCAYNDLFSCPIPPTENRLQVAITAGEKNFK